MSDETATTPVTSAPAPKLEPKPTPKNSTPKKKAPAKKPVPAKKAPAKKPPKAKPVKAPKAPKKFVHDSRIAVGKVYTKVYKGKTYKVKAVADGFVRQDSESPKAEITFKSLSSAAEFIMKKACSGYLFFGLEKQAAAAVSEEDVANDYADAAKNWNKTASKARLLPESLAEVKSSVKLNDVIDILRQDVVTFKRAARVVARR